MEIVRKFVDISALPREIHVSSELLAELLQVLSRELPLRIQRVDDLPFLEEVREGMNQFGGGMW